MSITPEEIAKEYMREGVSLTWIDDNFDTDDLSDDEYEELVDLVNLVLERNARSLL